MSAKKQPRTLQQQPMITTLFSPTTQMVNPPVLTAYGQMLARQVQPPLAHSPVVCQPRVVESRGDSAMSVTTPSALLIDDGQRAQMDKTATAAPMIENKTTTASGGGDENDDDEYDDEVAEFDDDTSDTIEISGGSNDDDDDEDYKPPGIADSKPTTKRTLESVPPVSAAGSAKKAKKSSIEDDSFDFLSMPLLFGGGFGRRRRFGGGFPMFGRKKKQEPKKKPPRGDGGSKTIKSWSELTKSSKTLRFKTFYQNAANELLRKFTSADYNDRLPEHPVTKVTLKVDFANGTSQQFVGEKPKVDTPGTSKQATVPNDELFSFF